MLYAYIKDKTGLKHGEQIKKDGQSYIVIKSIDVLTKKVKTKYKYFCLSCNKQVFFRHYKDKHDHFFHRGSQDCKIPESIEHLLVKMEIYKYLKLAGFEAKLETPFYRNGLSVRADVFARSGVDQLVVEVQATSNIKLDTIKRRNTIYAASGIPTAWIIVLDSFLKKYTGTTTSELMKQDDGSYLREEVDLPYNKQEVFQVIGQSPKAFEFLIEQYHYLIAISKEGKFFLIRKDNNGLVYNITRIPTNDLVRSLMATPLIDMEYEEPITEQNFNEGNQNPFKGEIGFEFPHLSNASQNNSHIDFEKGLLDEIERLKREIPFDTVALIKKINESREKFMQEIIVNAQAMERELKNEQYYKPKLENWKEIDTLKRNKIIKILSEIKKDIEQRLIEQYEALEAKYYGENYNNKLSELKDTWEQEKKNSERKLNIIKDLYIQLLNKENEQIKSLEKKYPYSVAEENERIKQLALKRRRELYGESDESASSKQLDEPEYLSENKRHKEKTQKERAHLEMIQAERDFKTELERNLQERMKIISKMEKEAGRKFTYALSQIEKIYGQIIIQNEEIFKKSMEMLQQSYEMIMKTKKSSSRESLRRDDLEKIF